MSTIKTTNIQHPSAASPAVELTAAGGLWLGGGKILQVVRATDTTSRTTSSSTLVDVTGMSVTVTPTRSDSAILIVAHCYLRSNGGSSNNIDLQIADSSNNAISGTETDEEGVNQSAILLRKYTGIAYATPATTSAVTYKLRFANGGSAASVEIRGDLSTSQMFALEVSA